MENHSELLIGLALFVISELVGMSKLRDNSLLQLLIHMGQELFPYEVKRKDPPKRGNRPLRDGWRLLTGRGQ
jgi:hypothetical protein